MRMHFIRGNRITSKLCWKVALVPLQKLNQLHDFQTLQLVTFKFHLNPKHTHTHPEKNISQKFHIRTTNHLEFCVLVMSCERTFGTFSDLWSYTTGIHSTVRSGLNFSMLLHKHSKLCSAKKNEYIFLMNTIVNFQWLSFIRDNNSQQLPFGQIGVILFVFFFTIIISSFSLCWYTSFCLKLCSVTKFFFVFAISRNLVMFSTHSL